MSLENHRGLQGVRPPTSAGVGNGAIDIVWHSSRLGERRWTEYLFSEVRNVRQVSIAQWPRSQAMPSIHVISTNDKETKARIPDLFIGLRNQNSPFGIFHMSDEWFREDTSFYKYCRFCLRNYWCSFIRNEDLIYIPLGYPNHCAFGSAATAPASERKHRCSFTGQMKYSRVQMVKAFETVDGFYYPRQFISDDEYATLMRQTVFSLCPMGNATPDTWRLYESLEAGAIPIVEKRPTMDYFRGLFGENPLPTFRSWRSARAWVDGIKSPEALDEKQAQLQQWWRQQKAKLRGRLAAIVRGKLDPQYQSALENYKPAYSGTLLKIRWRLELLRHLNMGSIPRRLLKNTGLLRLDITK